MGAFSDYLENKMNNHLFGKIAFTPPTIYVALSTADPGEDGSGMAEPYEQNGYARKLTAASDWNDSANGLTDNAAELAFPQATGSWGTITHTALLDAVFPADWVALQPYVLHNFTKPIAENGRAYECTQAGTTAASEPAWPTTPGQTVTDGTVIWTCRAYAGNLLAYGQLTTPKTIGSGDTPKFAVGDFDNTLD